MTTGNNQHPMALQPRDAAKMLCISPRTLWEWTRLGLILCIRIGTGKRKTVLYSVADLQAWLAQHTGTTGGQA
ncbi:helix-turn-helix domain-containing protein [Limnoglobus roseus]|uniref:Helix-turn-helix domain-containing protein n=1 Tax=Limnoglobus roseus TaxID=2598579 RepID=A0A5C1AFX9_9BACT|nr:helix-turn-helix domain-containing protein [Limnoglobus roseus]QEL16652.1 hypothetical protein PX52LOC_03613 [Limnoglobus roseus]